MKSPKSESVSYTVEIKKKKNGKEIEIKSLNYKIKMS